MSHQDSEALLKIVGSHPWEVDRVQFARLIAELEAAGAFTPEIMERLAHGMDLDEGCVGLIVDRAQKAWARAIEPDNAAGGMIDAVLRSHRPGVIVEAQGYVVAITRRAEGIGVRVYRDRDLSQGITSEVLAECETDAGPTSHEVLEARRHLDARGLVVSLDNGIGILRDRDGRERAVRELDSRARQAAATVAYALEKGTLWTMDSGVWLLVPGQGDDGQPRHFAERHVVRHPVTEGPERAARRLAQERGADASIAEFGRTTDGTSAAMAEGLGDVLSVVAPPDKDLRAMLAQALTALRDTLSGFPPKDLHLDGLEDMLAAVEHPVVSLKEQLRCPEFEALAPTFFGAGGQARAPAAAPSGR